MKLSTFAPSVAPSVVTASAPRATASSAPSPASQARSGVLGIGSSQNVPAIRVWDRCTTVFGNPAGARKKLYRIFGKEAKKNINKAKTFLSRQGRLTEEALNSLYIDTLKRYGSHNGIELVLLPGESKLVCRPLGENPSKKRR
jgi:hypothetical protein